ncbi:GspE/PulE family protein [Aureliella helgolandensis]|uniref:Type II secretion system protein E n=1 Tax=Aureliella helgolandensis TaxID=2527968 RepID=A0A518GHQ6_9BACT|nr:GspE/PulE family protein [Aureliella helgolandensis]QDV28129.1 Type II secretion system protein E [Aureliella helgolandensis]
MSTTLESGARKYSTKPNTLPLGQRLVQAGLISESELEKALELHGNRGMRLGESLVALGLMSEADLLPLIGGQLNFPWVRLKEGIVDPEVVRYVPRAVAEQYNCLALFRVHDELTVAMAEPQNLESVDFLEELTGFKIRPALSLKSSIERLLPRCYEEDFKVDVLTADLEDNAIELKSDEVFFDTNSIQVLADGSPVINLVNYLIVQAVRQGASDIHIEPSQRSSVIRFRVDGRLREVLKPRRDLHPAVVSRIKVMSKLDIAEQRKSQDGRFHVKVDDREVDMRVSSLPTVLGEKVVMRVLDRSSVTFNLDRLGVPDRQLDTLRKILNKPHGLFLVTGPTGSGKTTTLYSAVETIKHAGCNIVTVEDPVEYQLDLVNQVQVNAARQVTFASALRSILRQDPDIILVGEIRDAETAEVAIQAALTGHLVLSTLHTNDSASTVTRLRDMGIAPYKIAASLAGVVAQRLVRKICAKCRTSHYPTPEQSLLVGYEEVPRQPFKRGEGCSVCFDTGYAGRQGIYEIMGITPAVREVISSEGSQADYRRELAAQGGTTLLQEARSLAEEGVTTIEEVIRVALTD